MLVSELSLVGTARALGSPFASRWLMSRYNRLVLLGASLAQLTTGCADSTSPDPMMSDTGDAGDTDAGTDASPAVTPPTRSDGGPAICNQVDLLFVVDNSPSMRRYQEGLAAAFPSFVDAMYERLPVGTSLHIGITTTAFSTGSCSETTFNCRSQSSRSEIEAHYTVPSAGDTGGNGEQGRLFEHDGRHFFEADTADPDRTPLTEWFAGAAVAAGERGCSFEMSSAGAAYALHPDNARTNTGFLRDDDTVLVVFFLTDEPDKSPEDLADYVATVTGAKSACGGAECVTVGGLIDECIEGRDDPLWNFMNAFGTTPMVGSIDDVDGYTDVVGDALARVVEQRCQSVILF